MVRWCIFLDVVNLNKIVLFVVLMLIFGNLDDVVVFGFGFGWNFIDGFRDFLIDLNSSGRFLAHLCGKGFVNGIVC